MTTYNEASIREFGDNKHIVAYVEVDNPAYQRIRHFQRVMLEVPYFDTKNKGKQIGADFYFDYRKNNDKGRARKRLENILGVKMESF